MTTTEREQRGGGRGPAPPGRALTPRLALIGGAAAFVVLLAGAAIALVVVDGGDDDPSEDPADEASTAVFGTIDEFDRPDSEELGSFTADRDWTAVTGVWAVEEGNARIVRSDEFRNHAVVRLGQADGAAQVRLDRVAPGAGLVFRFRGPASYWSVTATPQAGTWNLTRVEDTEAEIVGNTGPSPTGDGTTIAVRFAGDGIEVLVNGLSKLTVESDYLSDERQVGMTARREGAGRVRFDEFVAALPGNRQLFVGPGEG